MLRQKVSELSPSGAQVDNVILFSGKENEDIKEVKSVLGLKQCGKTKSCFSSVIENPYNCNCFDKCKKVKEILKIFL